MNFVIATGFSNPQGLAIDPTNGNTTTLSDDNGNGTGPAYGSLRGITVGNGSIYVTDASDNEILKVDALTGDRSVVSGNGVGGTTFGGLTYGIAIYPSLGSVPEPSSLALLGMGAGGLVAYTRRGRPRRISSSAV
jgi:hypothetical protein